MKIIDSDNYAAAGIETMFFPGGEPHVKLPRLEERVLFYGKLRSWNDVGFAALVLDALEIQASDFRVFIPYFPGARQDRADGSAALTARVVANTLGTGSLHVFDQHSSALGQWVDTRNWGWRHLHQPTVRQAVGVISPDAGAWERAFDYKEQFHATAKLIQGEKVRNPQTGALSRYALTPLPKAGHYVIVDDICDGGGTFNLLMEAALSDPLGKDSTFELVVSHGIFSKGLDALHPRISHITTTDSWCRLPNSDRLTVLKLDQLFPLITGNR